MNGTGTPEPKLKLLYGFLKERSDVKVQNSYEEFEKSITENPAKLESIYQFLKSDPKVETYDTFEEFQGAMLPKKKEIPLPTGNPLIPDLSGLYQEQNQPVQQAGTPSQEVSSEQPAYDQNLSQEQISLLDQARASLAPKSPEEVRFEAEKKKQEQDQIRALATGQEYKTGVQESAEIDPVLNIGKTAWNLLAYQIPATFAAMASMPKSIRQPGEWYVTEETQKLQEETQKIWKEGQQELIKWANQRQQQGARLTKDTISTLDKVDNPWDAFNWTLNAATQAGIQIPLTVATGGASSLVQEVGGVYLDSVNRIAQERGITPEQVIEQGLDSQASALTFGLAAAILDRIGAGKVLGNKAAFTNSLRSRATQMLKAGVAIEAPTEYTQTWLEQIGAQYGGGKGFSEALSTVVNSDALRKERIESWAQGLAGGTIVSGVPTGQQPAGDAQKTVQQTPTATPETKETKPIINKNAEAIRSDQTTVPQGGNVGEGGQNKGSENIQLDEKRTSELAKPAPQEEQVGERPDDVKKEEVVSDREIESSLGEVSLRIVKDYENRIGEENINRKSVIDTAKKIAEFDKTETRPEHVAESLQIEIGKLDNWSDLKSAIEKGGIELNADIVKRLTDVGVNLPEEITNQYDQLISKRKESTEKQQYEVIPRSTKGLIKGKEFDYMPAKNLSDDDRKIETDFANDLNQNFEQKKEEYKSKFGNVLDSDNARELSKDYLDNPQKNSSIIQGPASSFVFRMYTDELSKNPPAGKDNKVTFVVGGPGSGKTTYTNKAKSNSQVVYNTIFSDLQIGKNQINRALNAGKDVEIKFIQRDPVESFVSVIERSKNNRRIVPIDVFVKGHIDSRNTINKIVDEYSGNERVKIELVGDTTDQITSEDLLTKIKSVADEMYKSGKITEDQYRNLGLGLKEETVQKTVSKKAKKEKTIKPLESPEKKNEDGSSLVGSTVDFEWLGNQYTGEIISEWTDKYKIRTKDGVTYPVKKELISNMKPKAQYASDFDGRTENQKIISSKRIGSVGLNKVVAKLKSRWSAIPEVVTDKEQFKKAWDEYSTKGGKITLQNTGSTLPNGFIYRDKIFINPDTARKDTPIHEFGHLWLVAARNQAKSLYEAGKNLVRDSSYYKDVENNPSYKDLSDDEKAEEALAQAIGERGAVMEDRPKWKKWWSDFKSWLRQLLGIKQEINLDTLTIDQFVDIGAKELLTPGEIGYLNSIHTPESALFRLKNYKLPKDAWNDWAARVETEQLLSASPEAWHQHKLEGAALIRQSIMTGIQDRTRPIRDIENQIVDHFQKVLIEKIDASDMNDQRKKQAIQSAKKNKAKLYQRYIGDVRDVHGLMDLMNGKVYSQIQRVREKFFGKELAEGGYGSVIEWLTKKTDIKGRNVLDEKSIGYQLAKEGLSLLDLGFYAYVKHAPKRNAVQRQRSSGEIMYGSGMTDVEAAEFMDAIMKSGKEPVLEKAWQTLRDELVVKPLQMRLNAGLIDQDTYDRLEKYYEETYVPLNVEQFNIKTDGFVGKLSSGAWGTGIKKAKGSDKYRYWSRINPFVQLMANYEKTVADVQKNVVAKSLYRLATDYPDPNTWKIVKPKYKVTVDENGEVDRIENFTSPKDQRAVSERGVSVMINGKPRYVVMEDANLAKVFRGANSRPNDALRMITQFVNNAHAYFRFVFTGFNPDFPLPNLARDLQDSIVNLQESDIKGIARDVVKGLPSAMKAIVQFERGGRPEDTKSEYFDAYIEMKDAGGEIAWLNFTDAEQTLSDVQKEIEKFKDTQAKVKVKDIALLPIRTAFRGIMTFNKVMEVAIRLSTYKSLRDRGISEHEAAKGAKNVTVNFNKRGEWSPVLNTIYLFLNAGIQGTTRTITALAKSKNARYVVASGILANMIMRALFDEFDEDDEIKSRLTESDMEESLIIWNPWSPTKPITIPVSYNMRPWKALSDATYDVWNGLKTPAEAAGYVTRVFTSSLIPMSESNFYPTLTQPFAELGYNERFYNDSPVYPAKYDPSKKDSETYFNTATELSKAMAAEMSTWSEGNDDILEISPNSIDYVFDWVSGGLKSYYKTGENAYNLTTGNKWDWNKVAIARRFVKDLENQNWRDKVRYYKMVDRMYKNRTDQKSYDELLKLGSDLVKRGELSKENYKRARKKIKKVQKEDFDVTLIKK